MCNGHLQALNKAKITEKQSSGSTKQRSPFFLVFLHGEGCLEDAMEIRISLFNAQVLNSIKTRDRGFSYSSY